MNLFKLSIEFNVVILTKQKEKTQLIQYFKINTPPMVFICYKFQLILIHQPIFSLYDLSLIFCVL